MRKISIINSYAPTKSKQQMLRESIEIHKKFNNPIILISHCSLPEDITDSVDYYIFEKDNTFNIVNTNLHWWIADENKKIIIPLNTSHEFLIIKAMRMALNIAKTLGYDFFRFTEFDNLYSDNGIAEIERLENLLVEQNKKFIFYYPEQAQFNDVYGIYYESCHFNGYIDSFLDVLETNFPKDLETYNRTFAQEQINCLEHFFFKYFSPFKDESILIGDYVKSYFSDSKINVSTKTDSIVTILNGNDGKRYLFMSNYNSMNYKFTFDNKQIIINNSYHYVDVSNRDNIEVTVEDDIEVLKTYKFNLNNYTEGGMIEFTKYKKLFDIVYDENENKITFTYVGDNPKEILISIKDIDSHTCIYSYKSYVSFGSQTWVIPLPKHVIDFKNDINFGGFLIQYFENDIEIGREEIFIKKIPIEKIKMDITNTEPIFNNYTEFFVDKVYDSLDIKNKNVVFDIGANVGLFTKFIKTQGAKKVYCFEPNPTAIKHLHNNFKDDDSVVLNDFAVSHKDGKIELNIDESNSLISSVFTQTNNKLNIDCYSFDTLFKKFNLNKIDLVKIDIEGGEFDIIDNLSEETFNKIDTFLIEYHDFYFTDGMEKVIKLINKLNINGYEVMDATPTHKHIFAYKKQQVNIESKKLKIVQIHLGLIPIPTDKWGAIEKIIWNYKLQLEKLGHQVDIKYPNEVEKGQYDIVHVHTANQALMLKEKGIPYFFTHHDHHAVVFGKTSFVYQQNSEAIEHSLMTMMPGEFLIDFFNNPYKTIYLPHGVDTQLYNIKNKTNFNNPNILCVANNIILESNEDRKGFRYAIEAAKILNYPITVVGPTNNNKNFFEQNKDLLDYDKITVLYDLNDDEIRKLYSSHWFFLNPSSIEAGHPNLTLLEALSSGCQVLATYEGVQEIHGLYRITRNSVEIANKIQEIMLSSRSNHLETQLDINKYDWSNIVKRLENIYNSFISCKNEYNSEETKKLLINSYESIRKMNNKSKEIKPKLNINYIKGAFAELNYYGNEKYIAEFVDGKTNEVVYAAELSSGMYGRTNRQYFTDWIINLRDKSGKLIESIPMKLQGKRVYIAFESKSLGDNLAWIPYVEEFRKKHNCHVITSTFWNDLFKSEYPEIEFVEPGVEVHNIIAMYSLGCFDPWGENKDMHPKDFRKIPLQQIASDILGLEFEEIKPKVHKNIYSPTVWSDDYNGKTVCITQHSTAQSKYWNNEKGWQEVVDYLNDNGYRVVVLGIGECKLKNVRDMTGEKPIQTIMSYIYNADFFIGISSGLAWLAWALGKNVILISGFTKPYNEFSCRRVYKPNVCNGCYNLNYVFDKGDWNWCPVHKGTDKQFECSKQISSQDVIREINNAKAGDESYMNWTEFYCPDYLGNVSKLDLEVATKDWGWNHYNIYEYSAVPIYYEVYKEKCYENNECRIEKNDIVVDIGANIGIFSRYASSKASQVYSIEPNSLNYKCLKLNEMFSTSINGAISDKNEKIKLFIDTTSGGHSLYETDINNTRTGQYEEVQAYTLENIMKMFNLPKIDFLKIDCEGAELVILNSLSDEMYSKINKIAMEYHHMMFDFDEDLRQNLIDKLIKLGYKFHMNSLGTHVQMMYFWR